MPELLKPELLKINDWVKELRTIPKERFMIPHVEAFLQKNMIAAETLKPYLYYAKSHYTRNLIFKCDLFEVLAICWETGQSSAIHNHRGQNCWMATPIGKLRVQNFRVQGQNTSSHTCNLTPTDSYDMDATHPGVVRPEHPVHQVLNLPEFGARATSIHVYSYPYASCEVYSAERGTYTDAPLHYTSEYGKLNPSEKIF